MIDPNELQVLQVGGFFHATGSGGSRAICIVTEIHADIFHARVITTQFVLRIHYSTAKGTNLETGGEYVVDSLKVLPSEIQTIFHAIDKKYRFGDAPEGSRLLVEEQAALLFADEFYGLEALTHLNGHTDRLLLRFLIN